ncbi:MAG: ABC transporter ATP-binding protein [Clostridiales bacterium]|mgnify:FL=1|nr:ABC transporter ATP-binding protein [Clostridiales bacterium]
MLELHGIEKEYAQGNNAFTALHNINLAVPTGECLAVVGKSGCGKTTLLNIIAGLTKPSRGTVMYNKKEISQPNRDIAVVFQHYGLFPWKTVRENLKLPLQLKHEKERYGEVENMLEKLELTEHADKYVCQLSGGQRQRVAIGRALLCRKKVLLMDEPFSALDPISRERLQNNMRKIFSQNNITAVVVTHNISEAVYLGDKIAVFSREGKEIRRVLENPVSGIAERQSEKYLSVKYQVEKIMAGENDVT